MVRSLPGWSWWEGPAEAITAPHPCPVLPAVRYFTEQHEMQLQQTPSVQTVANLVKEVRRRRWRRVAESGGDRYRAAELSAV